MKTIHLVIPDLQLPAEFAAEVSADLALPTLRKLLARGQIQALPRSDSLEACLCDAFGLPNLPIAELSAQYDGLAAGHWLRADPVNLSLQRDRLCLSPLPVQPNESVELCAHLNTYFAAQGLHFCAPHPQRWYLNLDKLPTITTTPLPHVLGENIRNTLPTGENMPYWHQLFNEIQMLLYAHPVNAQREQRGEAAINSVWFWGEGASVDCTSHYTSVSADTVLADIFATAAHIPFTPWQKVWCNTDSQQLMVWTDLQRAVQQGDFAAWRNAILDFEQNYAQPLWQALCSGEISQLTLDLLGNDLASRIHLTRSDTWAFWRQKTALC
ncbi:MAG: hypothetical protein PHI11_12330 [Gallionella sp.]|nr:hypothetical protein [Gallionella sp.]